MSEDLEDIEEKDWEEIRESLDKVDTEYVNDQLNVMAKAEVLYPDGRTLEWDNELVENYEVLIANYGGEDEVNQYLEIGAKGVAIAVEYEEEPVFAVKALEPGYRASEGPKIDLDTAI